MRRRYYWDKTARDWVEYLPQAARKSPYIISDRLNDVICPADGKTYDSKSSYYKAVKDAGLVIVGNDAPTTQKQPEYNSRDLQRDIAQVMSNYGM